MAQHDYVIANGTGAAVRSDLNNALAAIVTQNSGATEPATMYAYQWWADTTTGLLKLRNGANNAWITLRELDGTLTIEDGTAGTPGLAFADDLNTGVFSPGADQVAFTAGGTARLTATTTGITSALPVDVPLGSASAPTVTFTGDLNTGIYSPGADQVAISTGGTGRLFVSSGGLVGIGTGSPTESVHTAGALRVTGTQTTAGTGIYLDQTSGVGNVSVYGPDASTQGTFRVYTATSNGGTGSAKLTVDSSGRVGIGTTSPSQVLDVAGAIQSTGTTSNSVIQVSNNAGILSLTARADISSHLIDATINPLLIRTTSAQPLSFHTNSTERARIDSSGRLLVGTSTSVQVYQGATAFNSELQVTGSSASLTIARTVGSGNLFLTRNQTVNDGSPLGVISFNGGDGTNLIQAAQISAEVDGTPGANDMPGRLVFSVTADGSASPTEAMRLENTGTMRVSGTIYRNGSCGIRFSGAAVIPQGSTGDNLDNGVDLGLSGTRWRTIYAGTGTINTSDFNLKQDVEELDQAELSVAATIKGLIKKFRFTDAVAAKGNDARIHVGVIAQEVEQAFAAEGLNPRRYGMFCEDTLEDGSKRLGIRYDELLAFVIAAT